MAVLLAVHGAAVAAAEPVGPKLTPKLRDLLSQEMAQVLAASEDILGAIVAGDHVIVAERAQQIHDSFILQQSLTEQDRKDLMAAVPPAFVELDRGFHETSAELAAAARAEDVERELATFERASTATAVLPPTAFPAWRTTDPGRRWHAASVSNMGVR